MKSLTRILIAGGLVLGTALVVGHASAQKAPPPAQAAPARQASPAAIAAAKEILSMKNAVAMYDTAVPTIVDRTKNILISNNLNYQKDLGEAAIVVAKSLAGREKEITDGMAQIYTNEFSDQELKDLVAFYKSPLGAKLLVAEPRAIQSSINYMNQWAQSFTEVVNAAFKAEMKKRGKDI